MKVRAVVTDVADPKDLGRIKARLIGYGSDKDISPWSYPCTALAGPGYGFFCLPVVGDEVFLEKTEGGEWVWSGFCWSGKNQKPTEGTDKIRIFRTPVGHKLVIDEEGDINIEHSCGSFVTLKANGDVEIMAKAKVLINDAGIVRAVNTQSICMFTGTPHPQGSRTVFVERP